MGDTRHTIQNSLGGKNQREKRQTVGKRRVHSAKRTPSTTVGQDTCPSPLLSIFWYFLESLSYREFSTPPFQNIRCFRFFFSNRMYLHTFQCIDSLVFSPYLLHIEIEKTSYNSEQRELVFSEHECPLFAECFLVGPRHRQGNKRILSVQLITH